MEKTRSRRNGGDAVNAWGILMMVLSYSVVITLTIFCFYKVFVTPGTSETEHSVLDIDTKDLDPPGSGTTYEKE